MKYCSKGDDHTLYRIVFYTLVIQQYFLALMLIPVKS